MGSDSLQSSPGRSTWVLELLVPLQALNRFGIILGELEKGRVASSGWPLVLRVPGLMTLLVVSLTLDSARSCWANEFHQDKASSVRVLHFAVLGTVTTLKYQFSSITSADETPAASVPLKLKGWQLKNLLVLLVMQKKKHYLQLVSDGRLRDLVGAADVMPSHKLPPFKAIILAFKTYPIAALSHHSSTIGQPHKKTGHQGYDPSHGPRSDVEVHTRSAEAMRKEGES
ncbi:hypothetical protein Tco_0271194 [Tanacetum coccineum]